MYDNYFLSFLKLKAEKIIDEHYPLYSEEEKNAFIEGYLVAKRYD